MNDELTDAEVIDRVLNGDVNAYERLIMRYKGWVGSIVSRHVPVAQVEDVMQEVFIRAYRSLPSFRGRSSYRRWLAQISVRQCYDYWRTVGRQREVAFSDLSESGRAWMDALCRDQAADAYAREEYRQIARDLLGRLLAGLPAEDRTTLTLMYIEGRSGREAAELMGWSVIKTKVRAFRARQAIRVMLDRLLQNQEAGHEFP